MLCGTLLAKLVRDYAASTEDVELFGDFIECVVQEVKAPREVLAVARLFHEQRSPWLSLEIPLVKRPADRFLNDQALRRLRALGFLIQRTEEHITVGFPRSEIPAPE